MGDEGTANRQIQTEPEVVEDVTDVKRLNRWQAFGIHLGISLVIFCALMAVIFTVLYPGILFQIDGGWTGLRIIIGVDLIVGPLLTLIVFKAGKPGLKFDLTCIGVAQAACIAYGLWLMVEDRPISLVLAYDTIYSLSAQEYREFGRDRTVLEEFPGAYPKLLYVELPEIEFSADVANLRSQFIGDPLYIQTENYRAIAAMNDDLDRVFRRESLVRRELNEDVLAQLPDSCRVSKFISAVTIGYVCFDAESGVLTNFVPRQRDVPSSLGEL